MQKNIFFYIYYGQVFKRHGIDKKRIMKRIIKKIKRITSINEDQSGSDSDINELCESEKEFDNINKILTTMRMKIITIHTIKKRMCIISDIESESETKNADNEENTVKTESPFSCNLRLFLDLAIINAWIIIQRDQNCNKLK